MIMGIVCIGVQSELNEKQSGCNNLSRRNSSLEADLTGKQEMIRTIQRKSREEKVIT